MEKNLNIDTKLSEISLQATDLKGANSIIKNLDGITRGVKDIFGDTYDKSLKDFCLDIVKILEAMKYVFGFSSDGDIKKIKESYKKITSEDFNITIKTDIYQNIVERKNSFLELQAEIKSAFDQCKWDSYTKKDGKFKDQEYSKLKKSVVLDMKQAR